MKKSLPLLGLILFFTLLPARLASAQTPPNYPSKTPTPTFPESCGCTAWQNQSCGGGNCSNTQMYQSRSCTPDRCQSESRCVTTSQCSQISTPTIHLTRTPTRTPTKPPYKTPTVHLTRYPTRTPTPPPLTCRTVITYANGKAVPAGGQVKTGDQVTFSASGNGPVRNMKFDLLNKDTGTVVFSKTVAATCLTVSVCTANTFKYPYTIVKLGSYQVSAKML